MDKAGDGPGCGEAVATLIEFSNADIHTDPVLHDACSLDLSKFCREVPQGNSQQVTCILTLVVNVSVSVNVNVKNVYSLKCDLLSMRNMVDLISNISVW